MIFLYVAAFVLMVWLILAGKTSGDIQYYVWSFVVALLWSQAAYRREPKQYEGLAMRLIIFGMVWAMTLVFILGFYWMLENPEALQGIITGGE